MWLYIFHVCTYICAEHFSVWVQLFPVDVRHFDAFSLAFIFIQNASVRGWEMAEWLSELTALTEDQVWFPALMWSLTTVVCNSGSKSLMNLAPSMAPILMHVYYTHSKPPDFF